MIKLFLSLVFAFNFACLDDTPKTSDATVTKTETTSERVQETKQLDLSVPIGLRRLVAAYPDFLDSADENTLYWIDGTEMIYDDGREKTHDEKLNDPDLEDMMSQEYVAGWDWNEPPALNFEPGRIRYEPFFKKMYGGSEREVRANLVSITWIPGICGTRVSVNKVNEVSEKLKIVSDELAKLPKQFHKYINETAGTFVWRNIAGTNRLSTHAFGTSIDINTKYSNYWRWDGGTTYRNQIPMEIVEIFEKHGFIWGGKWYHYDTMHFEYRPELLTDIKE